MIWSTTCPEGFALRGFRLRAPLGAALAAFPTAALAAVAQPRLLSAGNFTVMAASAITNTGSTVITGNLAISPNKASSVTGFPPGVVTGAKDEDNAVAIKAQTDLVTTYNDAAHATPFKNMSGVNLGGKTLTPGVYHFSSSAQLTGTRDPQWRGPKWLALHLPDWLRPDDGEPFPSSPDR